MKMKIAVMSMLVLVALSSVGITYGLWYKVLYINGMTDTGDLDAIITDWFGSDNGLDPYPPVYLPGWSRDYPQKDVGSVCTWIDKVDPQICDVEIHNGYPCYNVHFSLTILNSGTVPWILEAYRVNGVIVPEGQWGGFDVDGEPGDDIELYFVNSIGEQREPGQLLESSLDIHVMQSASENIDSARFTIELLLVQWNEYPSGLWT